MCVTHKHDKFCNWNGSANAFSCRYTANFKEISMTGWSFTLKPDKLMHKALRNKCMLKTAGLESCSKSYLTKAVARLQPDCTLCAGLRQRRFHVLASPVSIVVERLILEHDGMIASWTMMTGQRIRLTCAPACTSVLGPRQPQAPGQLRLRLRRSRDQPLVPRQPHRPAGNEANSLRPRGASPSGRPQRWLELHEPALHSSCGRRLRWAGRCDSGGDRRTAKEEDKGGSAEEGFGPFSPPAATSTRPWMCGPSAPPSTKQWATCSAAQPLAVTMRTRMVAG